MDRSKIKTNVKKMLENNIFSDTWLIALLVCFLAEAIIVAASGVVAGFGGLIVVGPISYSLAYIFLNFKRTKEKIKLENLFIGFKEDFTGNLLLGLMTCIFIFLWSLLFVIPGIVKYYAYSFAFYIKKDHPDYDWKKCIDESIKLTNGHKMDLFVLDLSFIGWYLLGSLCFGIGSFFVSPYHTLTKVEYYEAIKTERIQ